MWLAGVVRNDTGFMRRGMAIWLLADGTLDRFRRLGQDQAKGVCHTVLEELQGWLGDQEPERVARAHAELGGLRARLLARSYLIEYLKQECYLDTKRLAEKQMIVGLLDTFFTDRTCFPQDLAPALPSTEHADRARAGTEPRDV
jgi:hypothetical protein